MSVRFSSRRDRLSKAHTHAMRVRDFGPCHVYVCVFPVAHCVAVLYLPIYKYAHTHVRTRTCTQLARIVYRHGSLPGHISRIAMWRVCRQYISLTPLLVAADNEILTQCTSRHACVHAHARTCTHHVGRVRQARCAVEQSRSVRERCLLKNENVVIVFTHVCTNTFCRAANYSHLW